MTPSQRCAAPWVTSRSWDLVIWNYIMKIIFRVESVFPGTSEGKGPRKKRLKKHGKNKLPATSFFKKLKYSWLKMFCFFQVCNTGIQYMYMKYKYIYIHTLNYIDIYTELHTHTHTHTHTRIYYIYICFFLNFLIVS